MSSVFDSISDIINRQTGGVYTEERTYRFFKNARVNGAAAAAPIAGQAMSLWLYQGQPGSDTALPGAVAIPTNATSGALQQDDPGGGRTKYLQEIGYSGSATGTVLMYDRLLHISGLSGTNAGAQTVGGSITRWTGTAAAGNRIYCEIFTQVGATTSVTITAAYTNQDGSGATTQAVTFGATNNREAQRWIELPLAAGDTGARGVTSCTLSGTTGTIGDFGITIGRPVCSVALAQVNGYMTRDFVSMPPSMPQIATGACLAFAFYAASTTVLELFGHAVFIEK